MAIRRRLFAPLVMLLIAAHMVTSIGCATARLQTEGQTPSANAISYAEATGGVAPASYSADGQAAGGVLSATPDAVAPESIDVDTIVRGQYDHGYGPIREFFLSPYTIGALFVAALVVPQALD